MAGRFEKKNWHVGGEELPDGTVKEWPGSEGRRLAVLMDIRDELQRLNRLLHCVNFTSIPGEISAIKRHTKRIPVQPRTKK